MNPLICEYSNICSGCSYWGIELGSQKKLKQEKILDSLRTIKLVIPDKINWPELPAFSLRDRLDFQLNNGNLGLWNKNKTEILDLDICLQLSPNLQSWLTEFRKIIVPKFIQRGSIRLRAYSHENDFSTKGFQKGVWLDFSNENIRDLFAEKKFLLQLLDIASVEIGQKRKKLIYQDEKFYLKSNFIPQNWTSILIDNVTYPLACKIADFTQVGEQSNLLISQEIINSIESTDEIVEYGSGIGSLTLAASTKAKSILACESDQSALASLDLNQNNLESFLNKKLPIKNFRNDFHSLSLTEICDQTSSSPNTLLVNPPRSGCGKFFEGIENSNIKKIIYLSCYPESLIRDLKLLGPDWSISKLTFIDQFPQTDHVESLVVLTKNKSINLTLMG